MLEDDMASFDPDTFKETTRTQWDQAAEAWDRWGPLLNAWLGPATERMLDRAGVEAGSRVLDVAAGAGEQTILPSSFRFTTGRMYFSTT